MIRPVSFQPWKFPDSSLDGSNRPLDLNICEVTMENINAQDLQVFMLIGIFLLGSITFLLGLAILMYGAWGKDLRTIADQTTSLAQKGIAEEISGLVGNASTLMSTLNDVMRTSNGIGFYLTIIGGMLMLLSSVVLLKSF